MSRSLRYSKDPDSDYILHYRFSGGLLSAAMDLAEAHAGETKAVDATRKSSLDEAALDAVMLMHRHVFMQQLTMFSELSGKVTLSEGDIDASIPELLLKRAAANEEMIRKDGQPLSR